MNGSTWAWSLRRREMGSPLNDPTLEALVERLHAQSDLQSEETHAYFARRDQEHPIDQAGYYDDAMYRFLSDKMVALDREKAGFCYLLCRSQRATRVVEAGTSFGVSTLYLAAAVRDNQVEDGVVIGTEYEPAKAEIARAHFKEAGLSGFIELREGDLRQTLQDVGGPVDFMLVDIWEVALPALRTRVAQPATRGDRGLRQHCGGQRRVPRLLRVRQRPHEPFPNDDRPIPRRLRADSPRLSTGGGGDPHDRDHRDR